jgi:cellobiose-specific phosphotransferase system component IIC
MVFNVGDIFLQWQMGGVFEFLLPAFLIFAIVYGIMQGKRVITDQKGINIIIALVVSLLSVGYTSSMGFSLGEYLMEMFPRLGVGLSILLGLLVLTGLFINDEEQKYWNYGLGAIGVIIAIIIVSKSFDRFGWVGGNYNDSVGWIVGAVLVVGLIIAVAASGGDGKKEKKGG